MTTPFARPSAGGDKFEPKDWNGALMIVFPKSYNPNETTTFGPSTSADCDIVIVDRVDPATGGPVFVANARLFGNLANSVRDSIGSQVLGRLGQVPTNKGNPAWVLTDVVDDAAQVAMAMPALTAYQQGQFKAAAPTAGQSAAPASANYQATMQQDPWAGVNAAPAPAPQQYQQPQMQPPPQQQYAPPAAAPAVPYQAPAPVAAAGGPSAAADPHTAFLTSRGMAPDAVAAMDPATRANVAQQLGFTG